MNDWTENGRIRLKRKEKIKGREAALDDESKRPHGPRRSGSGVSETERRSLFPPVHARTNIGASVEYMCQIAERKY